MLEASSEEGVRLARERSTGDSEARAGCLAFHREARLVVDELSSVDNDLKRFGEGFALLLAEQVGKSSPLPRSEARNKEVRLLGVGKDSKPKTV